MNESAADVALALHRFFPNMCVARCCLPGALTSTGLPWRSGPTFVCDVGQKMWSSLFFLIVQANTRA